MIHCSNWRKIGIKETAYKSVAAAYTVKHVYLSRLFARSGLTQNEVDMLRGVCAAIICSKHDRAGAKKEISENMRDAAKTRKKSD